MYRLIIVNLRSLKLAYRKGLGTCDALLYVYHTMQSALESGQGLGLCTLISAQPLIGSTIWEFSICMLCSVGIGGSMLSILTEFLSNRSQHVMVDGCWSKLVNVVSGVLQGRVLGP